MERVAVVTGSNKGIGYATVKGLCKQFAGAVCLTSRNEKLGNEGITKLDTELPTSERKCSRCLFHQLDITDLASIKRFKEHLLSKHGGLDILVNSAGIAYKVDSIAPFAEQAEVTNQVTTLEL